MPRKVGAPGGCPPRVDVRSCGGGAEREAAHRHPPPAAAAAAAMEGLPASNRFDLVGAGKAVTAVEADANGARLVCGSHDYKCYLYDFGGLKADGKSFRSWEVRLGGAPEGVLHPCTSSSISELLCASQCAFLLTVPCASLAAGDGRLPGGGSQLVAHGRCLPGGHFVQPGMRQPGGWVGFAACRDWPQLLRGSTRTKLP